MSQLVCEEKMRKIRYDVMMRAHQVFYLGKKMKKELYNSGLEVEEARHTFQYS